MIFDTLKSLLGKKEGAVKASVTEEKAIAPPKKKKVVEQKWTKAKLQNVTEKDIINYMTRAGTKNKLVQDVLLNEARKSASEKGQSGNLAVLREVVKALKKPK